MLPETFWACTLAEVLCFLKGYEDREKLEWQRQAHFMSLMYNMNRGRRNKELSWQDFTPFTQELKHGKSAEITPELVADLKKMQHTLNTWPKTHQQPSE